MNLARVNFQHIRNFALFIVDGLRSGDHVNAAVIGRPRDGAFRLKECVLLPRNFVRLRNRIRRLRDGLMRVSAHEVFIRQDIASGMKFRGIVFHRVKRIEHGRQHRILDFDQVEHFLKAFALICRDKRDGVTDKARNIAFADHDIPVLHDVTDLVFRHVIGCQDGDTIGMLQRFRDIDAVDADTRIFRT